MLSEKTKLIPKDPEAKSRYVLVIHGGAGAMTRAGSTPEQEAAYKTALSKALQAGYAVLKEGGEAMDAAVAAVSFMEGSCFAFACLHLPNSKHRLPAFQFWQGCRVQCCWKGTLISRSH